MKNSYPKIVCWKITSKCNRKCPFCFRPNCRDLNTKQIYKIIDNLAVHGVKGIGITGGEPLLRKDIINILKYIRNKNIDICFATNTDFYSKRQESINKYVSTIGIPIEGSTKEIHDSIRGVNNLGHVTNTINKIYHDTKIPMYFTTVITHKNINDLINIENILEKYKDRILYWKIYEFIGYPDRPFQYLNYRKIPQQKIKKIINSLGKKLGKDKIFYLSTKDRSGVSFIINSDGGVAIPIEQDGKTRDCVLGNFLKDEASKIFNNWDKLVDYKKYACHLCALKCLKVRHA